MKMLKSPELCIIMNRTLDFKEVVSMVEAYAFLRFPVRNAVTTEQIILAWYITNNLCWYRLQSQEAVYLVVICLLHNSACRISQSPPRQSQKLWSAVVFLSPQLIFKWNHFLLAITLIFMFFDWQCISQIPSSKQPKKGSKELKIIHPSELGLKEYGPQPDILTRCGRLVYRLVDSQTQELVRNFSLRQ